MKLKHVKSRWKVKATSFNELVPGDMFITENYDCDGDGDDVIADGKSITVVPVGRQVTTQQAADILNVSRQYLVRLLNEGRIPHTKTGRHRRLTVQDVVAFKQQRDRERRDGFRELARITQDGGGYDDDD